MHSCYPSASRMLWLVRGGLLAAPDVFAHLAKGTRIGTGSVRRIAQLAPLVPGATFAPVRGNVDTRLAKLDAGGFDALVLACAGLRRLGFGERLSCPIPIDQCVPAPGQGIVATEIRSDDEATAAVLRQMHDEAAGRALTAERRVVADLGGGCQLPLGAIATERDGTIELLAVVASLDGTHAVRRAMTGPSSDPDGLGRRLAEALEAERGQVRWPAAPLASFCSAGFSRIVSLRSGRLQEP